MSEKPETRISLHVTTDNPETVARVAEYMARTMAGLGLDGVECMLSIGPEWSFDEELDREGD